MSDPADKYLDPSDLTPMTPEQIEWVRSQRITEPPEPEECRALPPDSGRCAYAGPNGEDACGEKCIYIAATALMYDGERSESWRITETGDGDG